MHPSIAIQLAFNSMLSPASFAMLYPQLVAAYWKLFFEQCAKVK